MGWEAEASNPSQQDCPEKDITSESVPVNVSGSNGGADDDGIFCYSSFGQPIGLEGGHDVIYSWVVPEDGRYQIDTIGSKFDTVLTVELGVCPGTPIGCNDDDGGDLTSLVQVDLQEGDEIEIIVDSYDPKKKGKYYLNIDLAPI